MSQPEKKPCKQPETDIDRYVYIERTHCPDCGQTDLQTIRSEDQGDGSTKRRTQCRKCFYKFFVIVE
jgi:hypothetical protein